jgi:uncharacterized protein YktB (UPF0637 family)
LKQNKGGHIVENFRRKILVVTSHFYSDHAHGYALRFQITLFGYHLWFLLLRILRVAAKRKATEDISQRPSKVIKSVLYDIQEDHLQPKDLRSTSQAMYRERHAHGYALRFQITLFGYHLWFLLLLCTCS